MEKFNLNDFKRGWIVGNFKPNIFKANIEVGIHSYPSGTIHEAHYHKLSKEINVVIQGTCSFVQLLPTGSTITFDLQENDIFVVEPNDIFEFIATSDCKLTVIKTISNLNDKYIYNGPNKQIHFMD
jgi:oxalate decarboxylase/phosphoglucose isomerase-like protein (cupin superfamily)